MRPLRTCFFVALAATALSLPALPLAAQTGEDAFDFHQLAVHEWEQRREMSAIWPAADRRDHYAQEFDAALDRAEETFRLSHAGLLSSFAEIMRRDRWFDSFNNVGLPHAGNAKNFSCSLQYGTDYEVPFGSYSGNDLVRLHETSSEPPPLPIVSDRQLMAMGGAWSFEPAGLLLRMVEMVDARVTVDPVTPSQWTDCSTVIRYRYLGPRGDITFTARDLDPVCNFRIDGAAGAGACGPGGTFLGGASYPAQCSRPTQYWSTHGQIALDLSDPQSPVVRYPDGAVEVLGWRATDWSYFAPTSQAKPFYAHHQSLLLPEAPFASTVEAYWTTVETRDRNGNRTVVETDPVSRQVVGIVDPQGRRTSYVRDAQGNVTAIRRPGVGGALLTWSLAWQSLAWPSPNKNFPEIDCWQNNAQVTCPAQSSTTLESLTMPDGRAYRFTYEPWGSLASVQLPDGGAMSYAYGNSGTTSFVPAAWKLIDILGHSHFDDNCPRGTDALLKRRLVSTTSLPQGLAGPGFVTSKSHASESQLRSAPQSGVCWKLQWLQEVHPDGKIRKLALCEENESRLAALDGRVFADEVWDGSGLREATYYGNPGTVGDISTPVGTMYVAFQRTDVGLRGNHSLDARPTRIVHLRDGVQWTEVFSYDSSGLPAANGEVRTLGNVTTIDVLDSTGARLRRTATTFLTDPAYLAKNLIRLATSVRVEDGAGTRFARSDTSYDQFPLQLSLAPNWLDPGPERGNPTTFTRFAGAAAGSGGVTTTTRYFETGSTYQVTDPRGAGTTTTRPAGDFAICSATHPTLSITTTNELGHSGTTVLDCFGDLQLSISDANGQLTQTAYDRLGRILKVAGPGDSLASPTRWYEYFWLGSSDNTGGTAVANLSSQRTVARVKDGTADGLYAKTFTDGLGRSVQVRREVDPAVSGGLAEAVTTQEYDGMGRIVRVHVPCFAPASDVRGDCAAPKFTTTSFDVLGRSVSVAPPGIPATTTAFGGDGVSWVSTVTGANGANSRSRTTTDILGRILQVERYWAECPGGACWQATRSEYDGAGRVVRAIDPAGNQIVNTWDDLGRLLTLKDPDMGGFANKSWSSAYDANGNLTSQTDAKGQTITFQYDLLNRVTLKDLPPAGPGEEDLAFFYDGQLPSSCYSCDDHCATTSDSCNASTLTCSHTGTPCDGSAPACTYSLNPTSAAHGSGSVTATVAVTAGGGCAWTAASNSSWLTVTGGASGSGNGTVTYKIIANGSGATRVGVLTIAGLSFQVTQTASGSPCIYSLSPTSATPPAAGGAATFGVVTTTGCAWTAASNASWITVTGGTTGSGSGTVGYAVGANASTARTGTITAAGQTFTVNQAAASSCTFGIAPTSASQPAGGGGGSVAVTAGSGCAWTASANSGWLHVTAGSSGNGNGTVSYSADSNPGIARNGTLTIAGQTFTVNQAAGSSCSFAISPAAGQHPSAGGGGNVNVTAPAGCAWTATANVSWLHITSGASGMGTSSANYSVDANPNPSPRSGTLTVAGQTFTANQDALVAGNRALYLVASLGRYVSVPSSSSLDVTGPFTVEAWVKTYNASLAQQGIVERYNWVAGNDGGFALRLVSGRPQFWVIRNATANAVVESPSALTGGWHHVAGVFTRTEVRIYVDGRLDGTTVSSVAPAAGTRTLKIGARGDDATATLDGYADEVRLSTGALYDANFSPAPHLTAGAGQTRALWRFDDTTAADSSGNGNHGTFVNGATVGSVDEYPEYGSLTLDGVASYVQVPDNATLDVVGKITLEAWIKTTAASANQRIVARGNYSLKLIAASGGNKLKLSLTGPTTGANHITSSGSVSPGVWHHVAGVYASGEMRLYIDGVLDATGASPEGVASGSGTLRIGAAPDGTEPFQGLIDEVRVAGKNLYSTPTIPREPRLSAVNGTRGLWRFDRHYVSDTSGNGNHGAFFLGGGIVTDVPTP